MPLGASEPWRMRPSRPRRGCRWLAKKGLLPHTASRPESNEYTCVCTHQKMEQILLSSLTSLRGRVEAGQPRGHQPHLESKVVVDPHVSMAVTGSTGSKGEGDAKCPCRDDDDNQDGDDHDDEASPSASLTPPPVDAIFLSQCIKHPYRKVHTRTVVVIVFLQASPTARVQSLKWMCSSRSG